MLLRSLKKKRVLAMRTARRITACQSYLARLALHAKNGTQVKRIILSKAPRRMLAALGLEECTSK